jgi:hypothetical protein
VKKSTNIKKSTSTKKSLAAVVSENANLDHTHVLEGHATESNASVDNSSTKSIKSKKVVSSVNSVALPNDSKDSKYSLILKKYVLSSDISPDKYFILCDGKPIKSFKELADVLQLMSDDMFKYHVTETKNDFANWINDVFNDVELAKKIRIDKTRLETSIEIYKHILELLENNV